MSTPAGSAGAGVAVARGDARAVRVSGSPSGVGPAGTGTAADDPATALVGNPMAQLGLVGAGGVLDGAFDLLRFRFRRFVALAAVVVLPVQLLDLWWAIGTGTTGAVGGAGLTQVDLLDTSGSTGIRAVVIAVLHALAVFLLGMAAGHLVAGWLDGRDEPFVSVVGAVLRRGWVVPVVMVVAVVAKSAAACFGGVGFFLVDALLLIAAPVAMVERSGPFATIGRSVRLGRAGYGTALAVSLGGFAITVVLRIALVLGPAVLVIQLGLPQGWSVAMRQAASLTLLVTMPLTACMAARAHVELRCRVDADDLRRRAAVRGLTTGGTRAAT